MLPYMCHLNMYSSFDKYGSQYSSTGRTKINKTVLQESNNILDALDFAVQCSWHLLLFYWHVRYQMLQQRVHKYKHNCTAWLKLICRFLKCPRFAVHLSLKYFSINVRFQILQHLTHKDKHNCTAWVRIISRCSQPKDVAVHLSLKYSILLTCICIFTNPK